MRATSEIGRQLFHIATGIIIIFLVLLLERETALIILFFIFLVTVLISVVSIKIKIPIVNWFIEKFERERVKNFPAKGAVFFMAGCLLTLKLFSQDIALASIAVLTFGDAISTLAGFFGQKYKHRPFSKFKTLYGTILGIVVSFLVTLIFIEPLFALTASFVGMLTEAISIKLGETEADDNLIIPLASGTACYLLRLMIY
ncbi:MAG: hypothetical protein N3G19_02905 [Candidatus Pacearchaeota archaeon]|nr:hypothetical protein [Candidatus Pacearchaeota archaeon]